MTYKRASILCACLLALLACAGLAAAEVKINGKRRISFNDGWRFFKGEAAGAEQPGFGDSGWRQLQLPHDWAIEGPFDRKFNPHCGGLPFYGVGWYRKQFTLPAAAKDKFLSIELDGAMSNSRVWLNGQELGGRPYGYIGFAFDLTPHLKFGAQENVLAVRLAPEDESSRWYPGAGIYRNVWLDVTGPVHVERWGVYVTTPEATAEQATVAARIQVRNRGSQPVNCVLQTSVRDPAGKEVGRNSSKAGIPAAGSETVATTLRVSKPQRWDIDRPFLYSLAVEVKDGARVLDRYVTPFGIRAIEFDKAKGFLLNGRRLKLQGVCLHHDLGALGAAVNRRATERQLQIMKGMGVNAIRTSHNPPSPELLEFCDKLGLLVMDEAFDMWRIPKVRNGYSKYFDQWGETDLRDMLRRDRNHPSVILWSIGNEIPEQGRADGWKLAQRLTEICHEEDRTRPVTAGFNNSTSAIKNGLADQVDIPGFNYKPREYRQILKDHPTWIIVAAETASTVSSRGVYHLPIEKYEKHESLQLTSYDVIAPPWAYAPDPEFDAQEKVPNVLGEFVWTGFDYLGEPTPYFQRRASSEADWPSRSSYFGIVDLAGFPKDRYYLYQSVWTAEPMVHVLPHWNWAGREGQNIPVMCYTNAEAVELFLNGRSLGCKQRWSEPVELPVGPNVSEDGKFRSKYRLLWQVPYQPGTLQAVALKDGKPVRVETVATAGAPARIALAPDRAKISADGDDLSFVTVRIEDKDGNLCPLADNLVRFKVEGAGRIAAVDNGNPATVESFQADFRKAFNGLCLLIVRSNSGQAGRIRIMAASDGLRAAEATVTSTR
jgi:beta-galactosidase